MLLSAPNISIAQQSKAFPFVMPWDDASPGTATDVSFLNGGPITEQRRIVVKDGHFVESGTGKRVRFMAVNFAAASAFPTHEDAEKVAARLAKLGINLVRLHHMDSHWTKGANIWQFDSPDRQHFDPVQVDRLQYLVAQLKKHGIYSDVNLHVSRDYVPADGVPASASTISMGKRVDNFDRRMIQLQKKYAHDLLTPINPYTGQSFSTDPAVFTIEINNENSLVDDPWAKTGQDVNAFPEPFKGELDRMWNGWLTKKYGTDAAITAAWQSNATPPGPDVLSPNKTWTIEHQGTSQATLDPAIGNDIHANVTAVDGTDWHVQTSLPGITLVNGDTYTLTFDIKSDKPRVIPVGLRLDEADWHSVGLDSEADSGTEWKTVQLLATVHDAVPNHVRIAFTLGGDTGEVWIRNVVLKPGSQTAGLQPGEHLADMSVGIPGTSVTAPQSADWLTFLSDTETNYVEEMRSYLKNDLHVRSLIIDTQISWGGLAGLRREANSSYADNHSYWQHPSFPHKPWDPLDWNIPDTSQVGDLAGGGGATLKQLAEMRISGRPYTISEYNEPAPNDYQVETVPLIMSYAASQDWDAVFLFDYGDYGAGARNNAIQGYFAVSSNPAKMAFVPSAALMFRNGAATPLASGELLHVSRNSFPKYRAADDVWGTFLSQDPQALWKNRLALLIDGSVTPRLSKTSFGTKGQNITVAGDREAPLYTSESPGSVVIIGTPPTATLRVGPVTLSHAAAANNFAAITVVALDGKSLSGSAHILITNMATAENNGMVWNATHTSVNADWGTGPTQSQTVEGDLALHNSKITSVYALDAMGHRTRKLSVVKHPNGSVTFRISPADHAVWYEASE